MIFGIAELTPHRWPDALAAAEDQYLLNFCKLRGERAKFELLR